VQSGTARLILHRPLGVPQVVAFTGMSGEIYLTFALCSPHGYRDRMIAVSVRTVIAPALNGEGWRQAGELGLALALSAVVGLEREIRQKNAGLRTHTLVGVGAALFMLISKYGFTDVC
jgi:hypothetical protein